MIKVNKMIYFSFVYLDLKFLYPFKRFYAIEVKTFQLQLFYTDKKFRTTFTSSSCLRKAKSERQNVRVNMKRSLFFSKCFKVDP